MRVIHAAPVAIEDLSIRYPNGTQVISGLNIRIEPGSYTLIAGPTGCGKSTLGLCLAGILGFGIPARISGTVSINGRRLDQMERADISRYVATVWQSPEAQMCARTVLDEVRLGLDYRQVPVAQADRRALDALEAVGLAHIDPSRDPLTLSGGEQQRLALAAALVLDAPVLIMDEATSQLDDSAAQQFRHALIDARKRRNLTIIAIDHRPALHLPMADRLMVLDHDGTVALDGPPEQIYTRHAATCRHLGIRVPGTGERYQEYPRYAIASSDDHALATHELGVRVGRARLLTDITWALPPGAIAIVRGPNGAGKSTLLRCLATELKPSTGSITPGPRSRVRAGIGYAPQQGADLFLNATVGAELTAALRRSIRQREVDEDAIGPLLHRAHLDGLAHHHPLRLSGGQRQRLNVASALATSPKILIADEPTSAQDVNGSRAIFDLLTYGASQRVTLLATHDSDVTGTIATHILDIREGQLTGVEEL
ncbi:MAG: ATP-binding cassette domain-containing protein [Actinomycetaceae bacterium]|nr:ATP-binding cassette domain-containing protein [Actinomycetaceae bacterium]